jgi:hypothetical protein
MRPPTLRQALNHNRCIPVPSDSRSAASSNRNSVLSLGAFLLDKMNLLLLISNAFINTMGITQPSPRAAKRAAWFIVALLSAVVVAIGSIAFLAIHWASHH